MNDTHDQPKRHGSSRKPKYRARKAEVDLAVSQGIKAMVVPRGGKRQLLIPKHTQQAVLLNLLHFRGWDHKTKKPTNICFVSAARIAQMAELHPDTVSSALRALETQGILTPHPEGGWEITTPQNHPTGTGTSPTSTHTNYPTGTGYSEEEESANHPTGTGGTPPTHTGCLGDNHPTHTGNGGTNQSNSSVRSREIDPLGSRPLDVPPSEEKPNRLRGGSETSVRAGGGAGTSAARALEPLAAAAVAVTAGTPGASPRTPPDLTLAKISWLTTQIGEGNYNLKNEGGYQFLSTKLFFKRDPEDKKFSSINLDVDVYPGVTHVSFNTKEENHGLNYGTVFNWEQVETETNRISSDIGQEITVWDYLIALEESLFRWKKKQIDNPGGWLKKIVTEDILTGKLSLPEDRKVFRPVDSLKSKQEEQTQIREPTVLRLV